MIEGEKVKKSCAMVVIAAATLLCSTLGMAQTWPQRAVKMVVPYPAGGNTDNQARIVAERLTKVLGQPVVVENRPGAGGAVAANYVSKAPADGYTLFFAASPLFTLPLLQKVSFDPYKDFVPISCVSTNDAVLAVNAAVPATTLKEFIAYAKSKPGQLNYATGGLGGFSHLTTALFASRAGLNMTAIAYKGDTPAVADLLGGQVQMMFGNASQMTQQAKGGKVRLLAVSGPKRAPQLPDLPAIAELYPGFNMSTWNGVIAPVGVPQAIVDRLATEIARIVHEPAVIERLKAMSVEPVGGSAAEFAQRIRDDEPVIRDAVHAAGLQLQ
jgi:tripartite-type tricarboxylate transporter receptor subunit TctC